MNLWYKISIPIVVITAVAIFVIAFVVVNNLKNAFFQEDFTRMQEEVTENIDRYLQIEYFQDPAGSEAQKQFNEFSKAVRDEDIARFTIWSKDRVILFSDLAPIIGYYSPDHPDLKRLFETGIPFFIKKSEDTNKPFQSAVGEFLDTYIPIQIDEEIQGAVELHMVQAVIVEPIEKQVRNIVYLLTAGGIVSLVAIFAVVRLVIIKPLKKLKAEILEIKRGM